MIKNLQLNKDWLFKFGSIKVVGGGHFLAATCKHEEFGTSFDCRYLGSKKLFAKDFLKLIRSLTRQNNALRNLDRNQLFKLPSVGEPRDHLKYYSDPKNAAFVEAFFADTSAGDPFVLKELGQTRTDLFRISPALPILAVSTNDFWHEISWGADSISGANPHPHPLS